MSDPHFDSQYRPGELEAWTWEETTRLIGEYVVTFQEIEATAKEAIAQLLSCGEEAADIVCSELSFPKILKVFISLTLHHMGEVTIPEVLNDLRQRMEVAYRKRNNVVHSRWFKNYVHTTSVSTFKGGNSAKRGFNGGYKDISIQDLDLVQKRVTLLGNC